MHFAAGQQIGHYTLLRRLGVGGMAEVWEAVHSILGSRVALKFLFSGDPAQQKRLLREGRAQAALEHPNLLPVRDIVYLAGTPGLVMPLVEGPSLEQLLQEYRPTETEVAALLRAAVLGVSHAHAQGLIHRDLKPGNILLEQQHGVVLPRISDFGLVKDRNALDQTRTGMVMGTPRYAAPEQLLDASKVDHRADLFSLGVVLVELLTGQRPFRGTSLRSLLEQHQTGPDLSDVPAAWVSLCQALLHTDPAARLPDGAALLAWLDRIQPPDHAALSATGPLAAACRERWAALVSSVPTSSETFSSEAGHSLTVSASALSPPDFVTTPPHLPAPRTSFVGRGSALATLSLWLADHRLISILGPGGTGKTRLALQLAWQQQHSHPARVWWCDLTAARDLDGIVTALGEVLDIPLQDDPCDQLGHALAARGRCLLVLDNFEQVVEHASATVGRWLALAPAARIVVTSQRVLGLDGEQELRLEPLSEDESVALFVSRAQARQPHFGHSRAEQEDVRALVPLLDGQPLAIELAAARIGVLSPAAMVSRMQDRFRLLGSPATPQRGRHAALRATIDWSWALLEDWEQSAFSQLSVFVGGFSLEAAEEVLDLSAFASPPWVVDVVQSLLDKSLLHPLGPDRLGMLLSLRDYAAEKLSGPLQADCRQRHMAHFARLGTREAQRSVRRSPDIHAWRQVLSEADNLTEALRHALTQGETRAAAQAALALSLLSPARGYRPAREALQRVLPLLADAPTLRAAVLRELGDASNVLGAPLEATQQLREALALSLAHGDAVDIGEARLLMAGQLYRQSLPAEAAACYQEVIDDAHQRGDIYQEAGATERLGSLHRYGGQMDDAERLLTRSLQLYETIGGRQVVGVLASLGMVYQSSGHLERAETLYRQALKIDEETGNIWGVATLLGNLGMVAYKQGRLDHAVRRFQRALELHRRQGNRDRAATLLGHLASLYNDLGRREEAEQLYLDALHIHRTLKNRVFESAMLCNLGSLYQSQGRLDQAEALYHEAIAISRELSDRRSEAIVITNLGLLAVEREDPAAATHHLQASLALHRETRNRPAEGYVLGCLAVQDIAAGRLDAGREKLDAGEALLREIGDRLKLANLLCWRVDLERAAGQTAAAARALDEAREITESLQITPDASLSQLLRERLSPGP